jgi:hypothetical protein
MHRRKHKILKSLVLGFAVAAFAAPSALADPRGYAQMNPQARPDLVQRHEGPGYAPINQNARPDLVPAITGVSSDDRALARGTASHLEQQILSPDDRAVSRGTTTSNGSENVVVRAIVSPDDRSLFRGLEARNVPVSLTVTASSDNFQWGDAGLGAAMTLAFVLLLGSATFLIRHQRRRIAAY